MKKKTKKKTKNNDNDYDEDEDEDGDNNNNNKQRTFCSDIDDTNITISSFTDKSNNRPLACNTNNRRASVFVDYLSPLTLYAYICICRLLEAD